MKTLLMVCLLLGIGLALMSIGVITGHRKEFTTGHACRHGKTLTKGRKG